VDKAVGEPGKHIKNGVLVCRQNVAQVGAVQDVLERRENADPDGRAVFGRNISGGAC
jgi:hypothetical protein